MGTASADVIGIPDDLVIEILLRMPAEHVYKFRRLSKFYRDVIEGADFIRRHYDRSIKTRPSFIIGGSKYLVDFESTKSNLTVRNLISPSFNITCFFGSCRGILCYTIEKRESTSQSTHLAFWNPLTRAYRRSSAVVYDHRLTRAFRGGSGGVYDHRYTGGKELIDNRYILGYDSATDDLKVLKIMFYSDGEEGERVYEFLVYSSKTDSWRRPREGLNKELFHIFRPFDFWRDDEVFVEGINCMHILATELDGSYKALAFDCADEKFNLISLPEQCGRKKIGLSSMDNCLCVYDKFDHECLDVWMMKEYGVNESWVRVFSLKPGGGLWYPKPLSFVNNGLQLLVSSTSTNLNLRLHLCDVESGELNETLHFIEPRNSEFLDACSKHVLFAASHRKP